MTNHVHFLVQTSDYISGMAKLMKQFTLTVFSLPAIWPLMAHSESWSKTPVSPLCAQAV